MLLFFIANGFVLFFAMASFLFVAQFSFLILALVHSYFFSIFYTWEALGALGGATNYALWWFFLVLYNMESSLKNRQHDFWIFEGSQVMYRKKSTWLKNLCSWFWESMNYKNPFLQEFIDSKLLHWCTLVSRQALRTTAIPHKLYYFMSTCKQVVSNFKI